jgi:peptidoglycan/LPS O-acetylase OafA/YrhL
MAYRPDIDGLRAVAVLSIVLFHIDAGLVPGGFIGVDVFFVISGFLITTIIHREMQAGSFSFKEFYRRRMLRIAPAYLVATLATLLAGCVLLLPKELAALGRSAAWSAVSLPNVYFWKALDTSYFAEASDQVPLLHLWSLGVEEQFYLLWPAMLLVLGFVARRLPVLLGVLVLMAWASYHYGNVQAEADPSFAYYMLPTRAGELLTGAILALLPWSARGEATARPSLATRVLAEACALIGYALLYQGFYRLDGESLFPGWNALYPCLGAAFLIASGSRARPWLAAPLRWKPVVWIGLISYSLYLWHWPVLAFVRYFVGTVSPQAGIVCFVAMLALAFLSYRWVELPFRERRGTPRRPFPKVVFGYATGVAGVIALGWVLVGTHGLQRVIERVYPEYHQALTAIDVRTRPALKYKYNCQESKLVPGHFRDPQCVVGAKLHGHTPRPDAILVGDSNAAHYIGVLGAIARDQGFSFRNVTVSSCPPLFGARDAYGKSIDRPGCTKYRNAIKREVRNYQYVFLGAQWSAHSRVPTFERDLARTIQELKRSGKLVVVLGMVARFPSYNRSCEARRLRLPLVDCRTRAEAGGNSNRKINRRLKAIAKANHAYYMDVVRVICPRSGCSPYLHDQPAYYDPGHLSMTGSWEIGEELVATGMPLRKLFERLGRQARHARAPGDRGRNESATMIAPEMHQRGLVPSRTPERGSSK